MTFAEQTEIRGRDDANNIVTCRTDDAGRVVIDNVVVLSSSGQVSFMAADGVQTIVPANSSRATVIVQNVGTGTAYLQFDGNTPSTSDGVKFPKDALLSLNLTTLTVGEIKAIATMGTATLNWIEFERVQL